MCILFKDGSSSHVPFQALKLKIKSAAKDNWMGSTRLDPNCTQIPARLQIALEKDVNEACVNMQHICEDDHYVITIILHHLQTCLNGGGHTFEIFWVYHDFYPRMWTIIQKGALHFFGIMPQYHDHTIEVRGKDLAYHVAN